MPPTMPTVFIVNLALLLVWPLWLLFRSRTHHRGTKNTEGAQKKLASMSRLACLTPHTISFALQRPIPNLSRRARSPSRRPPSRCLSPRKLPPFAKVCPFPQIAILRVAKQKQLPGCTDWLSRRKHFSPGLDLDTPGVRGVIEIRTSLFSVVEILRGNDQLLFRGFG